MRPLQYAESLSVRAMRPLQRIALLILLVATGPALAAPAILRDIRVWGSPDSTRVVLDLSAPANYSMFPLSGPERIVIDFDAIAAGVKNLELPPASVVVKSGRVGARGSHGLRIVLDVTEKVDAKGFLSPPNETYGHRLVVDLGHDLPPAAPVPVK